ncbi:MAG: hypothetical protein LBU57_00755 [Dysgonamonadaceae bacterium]|jgi:hypothetical protein|nr:hypothetical protein [Dysgonamonadaceae bacterium]
MNGYIGKKQRKVDDKKTRTSSCMNGIRWCIDQKASYFQSYGGLYPPMKVKERLYPNPEMAELLCL